jgi:acyl-CoA reductase-like NAD-dependent aldehyde dehydrogenase
VSSQVSLHVARLTQADLHECSTEKEIVTLQGASTKDVDFAVAAARKAFEGGWSELPAAARGDLLYKLASLIERDQELIAGIDALDNGKVSAVNMLQCLEMCGLTLDCSHSLQP